MHTTRDFVADIQRAVSAGAGWNDLLVRILERFDADSGTVHLLRDDGVLHLQAASAGIPRAVIDAIRTVPIGKGMAGLAVERKRPVDACNIQTDTSGDVRPGAKATGLQGSIVVPMLRHGEAVGALGIATRRQRTFTEAETELLLEVGKVLAHSVTSSFRSVR
jgi:signal transduction protein with GAF and PtsI domain